MNFFEHQDLARKKTGFLLCLFFVATLIIVLAVNATICFTFNSFNPQLFDVKNWWLGKPTVYTSLITIAVILAGTLQQLYRLQSGGEAVARMAGATAVDLSDPSPQIRKYIHVVEEMAIASGVPVPKMYIMEREHAINAFVAGYEPGESIVAVTRGALETLNRDELQGVIGHEFSHILNGDVRINLRLISILAGITIIGEIGRYLLLSGSFRRRRSGLSRSYTSSSSKQNGGFAVLGLMLIIIGYIGVLCGRVIKSTVSRQREFLADASAVQFTRNPEGIATALFKIGMIPEKSLLTSTLYAEQLNHLCFSESITISFRKLMASHPPIADRIKALDPGLLARLRSRAKSGKIELPGASINKGFLSTRFSGNDLVNQQIASLTESDATTTRSRYEGIDYYPRTVSPPTKAANLTQATPKPLGSAIIHTVGRLDEAHLDYAKQLLANVPGQIRQSLRTPAGAKYSIEFLILLGQNTANPVSQQEVALNQQVSDWLREIPPELRFPVVELCLPVLKSQPPTVKQAFLKKLLEDAKSDGEISLFEFLLLTFLNRHLRQQSDAAVAVRYRSLNAVRPELTILVWLLVKASSPDANEQSKLFSRAGNILWGYLEEPDTTQLTKIKNVSIQTLNTALTKIQHLSPLLKRPVLETCVDIVIADQKVNYREYEILRVLADTLDCPLPPLIPRR
ncbi:MAG: hypothetical protein CSA50_04575 [Gammaproteobacteria bacterium]|nr:MAG: hypothetical protein CSA50_04575 [Gammaproteobacteria bacterium]